MKKKLALFIIFCILFGFFTAGCTLLVGSTDLQNETLAGVRLMQGADIRALEKDLGPLTDNQPIEKGGRALAFDNPPYYAYFTTDADNRITQITVGYPSKAGNTVYKTGRGIGAQSSVADVTKAYGNAYSKVTYSNFMGSGDGYVIRYTDRENHLYMELGFIRDAMNGEFLSNIMMKTL